jgi:hypothetical protein
MTVSAVRALLLTVALCLTLSACATRVFEAAGAQWIREGTTEEEFMRDKAVCMQRATTTEGQIPEPGLEEMNAGRGFEACLEDLGYRRWGERGPVDRARDTLPKGRR